MKTNDWTDPDWVAQWQTLHPPHTFVTNPIYPGFSKVDINPWDLFQLQPIALADRYESFKRRLAQRLAR